MRGITTVFFVLVLVVLGIVRANAGNKDELKQIKQIKVVALDTASGYIHEYYYPDENLNDIFNEKMDTLVGSWYIQNAFFTNGEELTDSVFPGVLPDSVYIERLQSIDSPIPLSYNKVVKNLISLYTVKSRNKLEIMLGLSAYYFPIFEEILDREELPLELKYLPIIESALNPRARSWVGATGLWQFMYGTGKMMKLEVTSYVDERRDAIRSTEAAVKYLKQLYEVYGDWHLVIAAYNCGPGNVNRAIQRSGGKKDYWSIYYRLPRETRGYVPAYIAAVYSMHYYQQHNLTPRMPEFPILTDTIMVNSYLNLNQVADVIGISLEQLRELNPMYRIDVIPANPEKSYPLRIPQDMTNRYIDLEQEIFSYEREKYFPDNKLLEPTTNNTQYFVPVDVKGKEKVFYKVKSGDNIGFISSWFNVRAADVRYWNNVRRNLIRVGQKMVIYVPKGKKEYYAKVDGMSFEEKQRMIGKTPGAPTTKQTTQPIDPNYEYYTVRNGDNLWTIAKKFPGVSNDDIMRLNNISDVRSLYPGQKLKIRRKS